ncbi:MAG: hypothetical protein LBT10_05060 [Methanobrevibacter sp.]|jgi:hypothetical protein|nr:hypothetical protein [Methanobrevibacter sp.]
MPNDNVSKLSILNDLSKLPTSLMFENMNFFDFEPKKCKKVNIKKVGIFQMSYSLLDDFKKFMGIIDNHTGENSLNLTNHNFIGATILLPLFAYSKQNNINTFISKQNNPLTLHLEKVLQHKPPNNTTIPFEELPPKMTEYEIANFAENIRNKLLSDVEKQPFEFLIYEFLINIYDHSKFKNGYTLTQKYPNIKVIDACLIDDGVSIPGNFESAGFEFEDDAEAILESINGKSTRVDDESIDGIYEENISGRGLNSTTQLVTLGFDEDMLIASRKGLCYINSKGANLFNIDEKFIKGTYVSIRINERKLENFYECMGYKKIKKNRKLNL